MRPLIRPRLSRAARLAPAAYALFLGLNSQAATDTSKTPDEPKSAEAAKSADVKRLQPLFGATIKATYPDGRFQRYWLSADGGWTGIGRRGGHSAGRWSLNDDRLCLRRTKPFPAPMKYCTSIPGDVHMGASWPAKDIGGGPITLSVVKGGAGRSSAVHADSGKTGGGKTP